MMGVIGLHHRRVGTPGYGVHLSHSGYNVPEGSDESEAASAIEALFESKFEEE